MLKIAENADADLQWNQPSAWSSKFELCTNGLVAGRLTVRSSWGTLADGESDDGQWTFKRVGFFQLRATIRAAATGEEEAVFQNNTWLNGGTLIFSSGRSYRATTNFWNTKFQFEDETGNVLVRFNAGGVIHLSAKVEILPHARNIAEVPQLVLFGWYLVVMLHRDASAVAAVAAST